MHEETVDQKNVELQQMPDGVKKSSVNPDPENVPDEFAEGGDDSGMPNNTADGIMRPDETDHQTKMRASLALSKLESHEFKEGEEVSLQELLGIQTSVQATEMRKQLRERRTAYLAGRNRKWIVTFVGVLLGVILGFGVPTIWNKLGNALYDRSAITNLMNELIGVYHVKDAITDEVCIVAYDYNSQSPRLYSKYLSNKVPGIYDVKMSVATAGSSAAPAYFAPNSYYDTYGIEQLVIDGGIVANNPSLFATLMARDLREKKNIRLISFSTGTKKNHQAFEKSEVNKLDLLGLTSEFMMEIEIFNTNNILEKFYAEDLRQLQADHGMSTDKKNYYRCDADSLGLSLDKVDPESI